MIYINDVQIPFATFPNGETQLKRELNVPSYSFAVTKIWFYYESDADLVHLAFVKSALDSTHHSECDLFIAYMPYSRMDRQTDDVFTLRLVAAQINALGFRRVVVVEPHSDVTCALLDRSEALYLTPRLLNDIKPTINFCDQDYLFFPDAGAQKRYASLADSHQTLVGFKHRDSKGRITKYEICGEITKPLESSCVLIMDDLCSYGGTFKAAAEALGPTITKHLLVAHLEPSYFLGDLSKSGLIDGVYATDSIVRESSANVNIYNLRTGEWQ